MLVNERIVNLSEYTSFFCFNINCEILNKDLQLDQKNPIKVNTVCHTFKMPTICGVYLINWFNSAYFHE